YSSGYEERSGTCSGDGERPLWGEGFRAPACRAARRSQERGGRQCACLRISFRSERSRSEGIYCRDGREQGQGEKGRRPVCQAVGIQGDAGGMTVEHRASLWPILFDIAIEILDGFRETQGFAPQWSFGGGTALMLQIDHRESHEIDLFLDDPQVLPFLNPE